ncbi:hypothetical protein K2173_018064 [Erythroxylum novogranatense]|uniref:FAS1 domain-containing protein n=1 Tax=Erythroxylum novogranatense TaxID=1862640 RepID=A0AAV8TWT1_9ROSI|nr:hypothetical protein K2173_018064 [Erythroxylum novogranatense]
MAAQSEATSHNSYHTDMQAAIADIRVRSQSFYAFAVLLQMLNGTSRLNREDLTLLMPIDRELSKSSISPDHVEDFLLSHSILMPLSFTDLTHFPTGTMVPSGFRSRFIKFQNHGKANVTLNNVQVVTPNICLNSVIKCHGIDAVIRPPDPGQASISASNNSFVPDSQMDELPQNPLTNICGVQVDDLVNTYA